MPRRTRSAARVRLARSLPRLLAIPLVLGALGVALGIGGVSYVGGTGGWVLAGCGAALVVLAVLVAVAPFTIRVQVEESLVRVSWPLGRQVYLLTPGSLTRLHLRGPGSARLRGGFGLLGWRMGDAQLEDGERIHLVRLAPTESMIMIPTASGRLGITTSNEPHLVEALMRAARARAARGELPEAMPAPVTPMTPAAQRTVAVATSEEPPDEAPEGIMAAATVAPEATDVEPETAAVDATAEPGPATVGEVEPAQRRLLRRPSWARRRPSMPAIAVPALVPERVRRIPVARPKPSWLLLLVPLATAGATWGAAILMDRMPPTGTDEARLTVLGLVLAGPATTVGAIMARTWWPRVVEVVVIGGVAAAALIGRALLS